jgi:hypothetical protein
VGEDLGSGSWRREMGDRFLMVDVMVRRMETFVNVVEMIGIMRSRSFDRGEKLL